MTKIVRIQNSLLHSYKETSGIKNIHCFELDDEKQLLFHSEFERVL